MEVTENSSSAINANPEEDLEALIKLLQDETGNLSDADFKEIQTNLVNIVGTSHIALGKVLKRYGELPPQLIVSLIKRVWLDFSDRSRSEVHKKLCKELPKIYSPKAQELRMRVAVGLADLDSEESRRLITRSCGLSLKGKERIPSANFCNLFKELLLWPDQVLIKKIPFPKPSQEPEQIALCALKSCLKTNEKKDVASDPNMVVPVLKWLSDNGFHFEPNDPICLQLRQSITKWPKDFNGDAQWASSYLGLPQIPLTEPKAALELPNTTPSGHEIEQPEIGLVQEKPALKQEILKKTHVDPVASKGEGSESLSGDKISWELREAISRVSHYARILEDGFLAQLSDQEKKLESLEKDRKNLQSELVETKSTLSNLSRSHAKLSERIEHLQTEVSRRVTREKQLVQDKELQASELKNLRENCRNLDAQRIKLEQEKNELVSRVKTEAEFQVRIFKNKVQKDLGNDFKEITKLANMEMTTNLGIHIRSLVKTLFAKLKALGISFGGDQNG